MESNLADLEATQRRLSTLKYSQLRKTAKRYSVNANQKCEAFQKEVLITELSKIWNHLECNKENITPKKVLKAETPIFNSCSTENSRNDALDQTFVVESDESCTEKLIAANERIERDQESSFVPADGFGLSLSQKMGQDTTTPFKSKSGTRGALAARFAALHQKLAEKQPTLQEIDTNVKRKFAEHEKSVPDIFKRLATPKVPKGAKSEVEVALKTSGYKFKNVDEDPSKMNFSFPKIYGTKNVFTTMKSSADVPSRSRIPLPFRQRVEEVGVKELTKRLKSQQVRRSPRLTKLAERNNSVTMPQLNARLQKLATPKGKIPDGIKNKVLHNSGNRYKPYRRMIPYVDTTKMTDSQFYEAKRLGQIQTLTAISASRTEIRQQLRMEREEARERILKTKRGC